MWLEKRQNWAAVNKAVEQLCRERSKHTNPHGVPDAASKSQGHGQKGNKMNKLMERGRRVFGIPPTFFSIDGDLVFLADKCDAPERVEPCEYGRGIDINAYHIGDWPMFVIKNGEKAGELVRSTYFDNEVSGEEIVCELIRNPENKQQLIAAWVLKEDAQYDLIDRLLCTKTDLHYVWGSYWTHIERQIKDNMSDEQRLRLINDWHDCCRKCGVTEKNPEIWGCFDELLTCKDLSNYRPTPPTYEY